MKYCLLSFLLSIGFSASAQKPKEAFYIYDSSWQPVKVVKDSYYLMWVINYGDTLFIARSYKTNGAMVQQESYTDAGLTLPHGRFAWYDEKGRIDSTGIVKNRRKVGTWACYNDTSGVDLSITYDDGRETERRDYTKKIIIYRDRTQTFEEEKKQRDLIKAQQPATDEREAKFEGGAEGYKKYLMKNLNNPENLIKTGTVKIALIINKDGKVEDVHLLRSLQYSADAEAFRVLGAMPAWKPARQNGKNVYYQAIQYITFTAQ
jgi:protein TonB